MLRLGLALSVLAVLAGSARAAVSGTLDDFQDGTFQNWEGGADANVPSGGPAGAGDRFLQSSSGSFSIVPNLAINNLAPRYQGDYTAASITTLSADVKILQGSPIDLRVVLFGGTSGSSRATSTASIPIPADDAWHHVSFDITAAGLTLVIPNDPIANVLANVNRILLRRQSGLPSAGGTPVSTQMGFDNISITPEPGALAGFVLLAALQVWHSVRWRRDRPVS